MKHKTLIGISILKNVGFIKTQLEIKKNKRNDTPETFVNFYLLRRPL